MRSDRRPRERWAALSRRLSDERGSVTAEFAIVLPAVLVVLALIIGGIMLSAHRITLASAAAEVVRLEARGEQRAAKQRLADLGSGVRAARETTGALLCLTLSDRPGDGLLKRIQVRARACAATTDIGETP